MTSKCVEDPLEAARQLRMLDLEKKRIALSRAKCKEAVMDCMSSLQRRVDEDKAELLNWLDEMCSKDLRDGEKDEKYSESRLQFQPNPHLQQLLQGKLGCFTTSPLLPTQLTLVVKNIVLRPGDKIICSVATTEGQPLPPATLDCLEVDVNMGETELPLKKFVNKDGCLVLVVDATIKGCYVVSARIASLHVLGSPLSLPVMEDPLPVLAKLGLRPAAAVNDAPCSTDSLIVGSSKSTTDISPTRSVNTPPQPNAPEQVISPSSKGSNLLGPEACGKSCFVEHEGKWHAGVVHAVIHDSLVTVRNLTLDQFRGVHPSLVVFDEVDLPNGRTLAPSGLDLLLRKAEKKRTEAKTVGGQKSSSGKTGALKENRRDQGIMEATLGQESQRTVAPEEQRSAERKSDEGEAAEEQSEGTRNNCKSIACKTAEKVQKGHKTWREGETCFARWEEDLVWYKATVLENLKDQGNYLVCFIDWGNEAVVGKDEMVEIIGDIPPEDQVDEKICETLQRQEEQEKADSVREKIGAKVFLTKPTVGEHCVARWSDNVWYQASVEEVEEDGAIVLFTDFGTSDFVAWDQVELNASSIPPGDTRVNLPPGKNPTLADVKVLQLRMRLEVESPRRVAVVESTGEVLVLTKDEVRRYSRHGSQVSRFCSAPSQPSDMLLLKNGQVVIRDPKGLTLFSADGEVVRRLGSQTDHSVGMAEDQSGLLVTINKNNGLKKMKVTDAGETDIFFIDPERDVVLKRVEMSFLVEEEEDAVKKHMRLSDLYQHGERLLAFDEGNRRVFSFHQEDGEDVVEILPTDEKLGVLQFKAHEVAADNCGNYLFVDRTKNSLKRADIAWTSEASLEVDTPLARPSCLAVDLARNEIWLADFENNQLACYFSS